MSAIDRRRFLVLGAASLGAAAGLAQPGRARAQDFAPRPSGAQAGDERRFVVPALYYEKLPESRVKCLLCPRGCQVAESERGFCGVRENRGGDYFSLVHSRPCAINVDPIEKKPLFHYLPGSTAYSLATAGCNMECKFCQNSNISQFRPEDVRAEYLPPAEIARRAAASGARSLAYTYSEPVVYYEYMRDCARAGHKLGVRSAMISNGYILPTPLADLLPDLDAVKVDLKGFTEKFYADLCNAKLAPVLDSLLVLRGYARWFELVMLVLPTLNSSPDEMVQMARWIKNYLGPDVPLHLTRFHNSYKITNLYPTPVLMLERLHAAALSEGLRYVYLGNVPGHPAENTYCPKCRKAVIERYGFYLRSFSIVDGKCRFCGEPIAGVWT